MAKFEIAVVVTLRPSIADVEGKTIEEGLRALGFDQISKVRVGKYFRFRVAAATAQEARQCAEQACIKLLANPVIEDYQITVVEDATTAAI